MKKLIPYLILICLFCYSVPALALDLQSIFAKQKRTKLAYSLMKAGVSEEITIRTLYNEKIEFYPEILRRVSGVPGDFGNIFTEESLNRGKMVISENFETLSSIESRFGVPKELLVAIYRVETNLGRWTGKYVVANSLLTWIVSGTRRAKWAEQELISYLRLCEANEHDPFSIYGSTHGAFGLVQFIPSSFLLFAIDGNGDGRVDLFNFEDAMASAANYLSIFKSKSKSANWRAAVFAYNHDWAYVKATLQYASRIKLTEQAKQ